MILIDKYHNMIKCINKNIVPKEWSLSKFPDISKDILIKDWIQKIKKIYDFLNNWIYEGFAKVYDLSFINNDRLFLNLLPIYFQKKLPEGKISSDKIKIHFKLTKYEKEEEINESVMNEFKKNNGNNDFIFIKGLKLKGFESHKEEDREIKTFKENENDKEKYVFLPIVAITYNVEDYQYEIPLQNENENESEEEEDEEQEEEVPMNQEVKEEKKIENPQPSGSGPKDDENMEDNKEENNDNEDNNGNNDEQKEENKEENEEDNKENKEEQKEEKDDEKDKKEEKDEKEEQKLDSNNVNTEKDGINNEDDNRKELKDEYKNKEDKAKEEENKKDEKEEDKKEKEIKDEENKENGKDNKEEGQKVIIEETKVQTTKTAFLDTLTNPKNKHIRQIKDAQGNIKLIRTKVRYYKKHCKLEIPFIEEQDPNSYNINEPYGYIELRFDCEKDKQEEYFQNKQMVIELDK